MPSCPVCLSALRTVRQREGLYFVCDRCGGRAVTIPQIRRVAGDRFATSLLRQINANPHVGDRTCPFCLQPMRRFHSPAPPLELDACKLCGAVWFDPQEFEAVPEGAVESVDELRLRGAEALAIHKVQMLKDREADTDLPELEWKLVPALFGFPVESDVAPVSRTPWFTWSLALLIALVSIAAFPHLDTAVSTFGFIPAEAWRYGGLTLITSFFLHAGVFHLVGNLYFLLVFGDNVEDYLGRWRYGLLVLASTLTGDLVHLALQSGSTTPCIGASGGIAGVIVFYALQFPRARLGFLFRYFLYFRWIRMPAWVALVLWVLMQVFGVYMQLSGFSNVAATAHLGGAAVGFALWCWWRRQESRGNPAVQESE